MANELFYQKFYEALEQYASDRMFEHSLVVVRTQFLECTNRTTITGCSFTVVCLIVAQAMRNMLDNYGGFHHTDQRALHEAIGMAAVESLQYSLRPTSRAQNARYSQLVETVERLMKSNKKVDQLLNELIAYQHKI